MLHYLKKKIITARRVVSETLSVLFCALFHSSFPQIGEPQSVHFVNFNHQNRNS